MLRRGIGVVTGLRGASLDSAVIVDSADVYESVKRAAGASITEFAASPGVRLAMGGGILQQPALVQAPPYPPILYEVVQELVVFGARKIVVVARGYGLRKSVPPGSLLLPQAAVALDSVSKLIVPSGMPLIASRSLYNSLSENVIRRGRAGFAGYYRGKTVVTVDSPRAFLLHKRGLLEEFTRYKDVVAVDSVTAPLYAFQYLYPSLEVSTLVYVIGNVDKALSVIEENIEQYQSTLYRLRRMLTLLVLSVIEALTGGEGSEQSEESRR